MAVSPISASLSLSDLTYVALVTIATVGLAPYVGAGNIANTIPTMRRAAAFLLGQSVESVDVRFVAHHFVGNYIASYGETGGPLTGSQYTSTART